MPGSRPGRDRRRPRCTTRGSRDLKTATTGGISQKVDLPTTGHESDRNSAAL